MKRMCSSMLALAILLCGMAAGCSKKDAASVFGDAMPEKITQVEASGFYNGGVVAPWELTQAEMEELSTWLGGLSLKQKTFSKGEFPGDEDGGTAYEFNINGSELTFVWVDIGTAEYVLYNSEWYEIINTSVPPLGLPA